VCQGSQDRIQHVIQILTGVLCQKPQDEVAAFLKQGIFATVAAVGKIVPQFLNTSVPQFLSSSVPQFLSTEGAR